MANNNGHHSFYKEQQKSILGQEKWTAKRIGKLSYKILKWCLWGFLIIATLWGCVNEFIIQTSKNLGQGVEFYQADDFVYPNTYQAYNYTGYTSSKEAVQVGSIDNLAKGEDGKDIPNTNNYEGQTTPFNFVIVNPDFMSDDVADGYNKEQLFVNAVDYAAAGGNISTMYYNLSQLTFSLTSSALTYNAGDMVVEGAWAIPFTNIPTWIKDDINDNKLSDDSIGYKVNNAIDFTYYLIDSNDGSLNNELGTTIENVERIFALDDEFDGTTVTRDDVTGLKGTLLPKDLTSLTSTTYSNPANWKFVERLDTSFDDEDDAATRAAALQDKVISETNRLAFNNGTGIATSTELLNTVTTNGKSIEEIIMAEESTFVDPVYSVDFNSSFLNTGGTIYGGAQTIIVPIQKGFPVRIDEESQDAIEAWRGNDFNEWDTSKSKHDEGFDVENQMYGWTILDANSSTKGNGYQASVMQVYDSAEDAIKGTELKEENSFYADQRRLGWGLVQEGESIDVNGVATKGEGAGCSVFDEKIKSWMEQEKYMKMSTTIYIGDQEVSYDYGARFAGMESVEQATYGLDGESSKYYTGVLASTAATDSRGKYTGKETKYDERSILTDSVIPTAQDGWGESRVTFIGWADWGKAWDVQYGPLYGAFVFPLAQLAMFVGEIFGYMASAWGVIFSIIVIVFLTRGLGALLSLRGTSNQMKMQEVQTDVAKIKAKYSKYDLKAEPRMKQKQQMEIMALYRKKEINPMGSLGTIFITMPIFISLWIIISSLPAYKVVFMGNFSWAVSSWYGVFNMGWLFMLYLMVGVSVGLVQGISSKLPTWLSNKRKGIKRIDEATKEAQKKQNKTQNIMIGVFVFMGLTVPALFAFYWICSGFFTIILELVKHAWKVHVADQMKKDPAYKTPMARLLRK